MLDKVSVLPLCSLNRSLAAEMKFPIIIKSQGIMIVLWDFLRIFVSQIKQLELSMKKRILYCILFALSFCCRMTAASGVYDVREYGAKGQQNVSITGHGMIDGEGLTKHDTEKAGNVQGGSIGTGDPISFWKM